MPTASAGPPARRPGTCPCGLGHGCGNARAFRWPWFGSSAHLLGVAVTQLGTTQGDHHLVLGPIVVDLLDEALEEALALRQGRRSSLLGRHRRAAMLPDLLPNEAFDGVRRDRPRRAGLP